MKVLIDAVHAADVWTLGAVEDRLLDNGEETLWISRPGKDAVGELIEARNRPYVNGPPAGTSIPTLGFELLARDWRVWHTVRSFAPDVILTRSPSGVHAARLTRTPVLYDTDDGHVAGLLYYVAGPLADIITSPTATNRTYGKHHRKYQGYKELCYLHPRRFEADPAIRHELGLAPDEPFSVLRLTAFTASHDTRQAGMNRRQVDEVIERLSNIGRVLISSEHDLPPTLQTLRIPSAPARFHHVLAAAQLVVSDSQSVSSEAGVIGTPSLRFNTWAGRHPYQVELEERWGLTKAFHLDDEAAFFAELDRLIDDLPAAHERQTANRDRMLEWADDPVDDLTSWTYELAERRSPLAASR
ncbi:MAG: hypothetical protein ACPHJY_10305 [Acidimicrobiales bacterium]